MIEIFLVALFMFVAGIGLFYLMRRQMNSQQGDANANDLNNGN